MMSSIPRHIQRSLLLIDYDFEDIVKEKWDTISDLEQSTPLHTKLKDLKSIFKLWYAHTKEVEASGKNCILATLRDLDKKIDYSHTIDVDRTTRIKRMQELKDLEKLESMDRVHKSRVKWESTEPKDIKSTFLDFYNDKFSCHDSLVSSPPILLAHHLSIADQDFLESMVSMDEIKVAVWDCGSQKAPKPDGYSFMFIKIFWDLLKHDIHSFVVHFFSTDYRLISLIGIHYKIVAKILVNRLSKVIDSIISPEQYAFITGRQILDSPVILTSARTSILINRIPTLEFSLKRGLKQGDPLSSFSFIIVMEGIHMALNDGLVVNMFHDVKVLEMVVKSLESLRAFFFWGSSEDSKKLAWVKWSNILASVDKGGLGIGSLNVFNMSLLLK
ncbi:putative RNA-directed DNA polymerase, eukaryota, reverse transcriptase zinc-binding domain protein [Tanacetum coccineum]